MSMTARTRLGKRLVCAACTIGFALVTSPIQAQDIRRYGETSSESEGGGQSGSSGGGQMVYPGQPMPQTDQQSKGTARQKTSGSSDEKEGQGSAQSYEIRVHDPGEQMERGRLKERKLLNKAAEKMYQGIIPGERDRVDHLRGEDSEASSRSGPNRLTWVGFQPEDERTRVFVQTSKTLDYSTETADDGGTFVVTLRRTEFSARNFRRAIDTSYFERVVRGIEAEATADTTVELRIRLRESVQPSVESSGNYLYIDFPHEAADSNGSNDSDEH